MGGAEPQTARSDRIDYRGFQACINLTLNPNLNNCVCFTLSRRIAAWYSREMGVDNQQCRKVSCQEMFRDI